MFFFMVFVLRYGFCMDLGGTLGDRLKGDGRRPALTCFKRVQVIVAVGRALSYLHDSMKQIHRDVKVYIICTCVYKHIHMPELNSNV